MRTRYKKNANLFDNLKKYVYICIHIEFINYH